MTVALDTTSTSGYTTSNANTWSHAGGSGSNRLALVAIAINNNQNKWPTSVTYGGAAMTLVSGSGAGLSDIDWGQPSIIWYYLKAPATGTQTVSVTLPDTTGRACFCATFTGVDQTTPVSGVQRATNNGSDGASKTFTFTTVSGDYTILAAASSMDSAVTPHSGDTELWDASLAGSVLKRGWATSEAATSTSTVIGYTGDVDWRYFALSGFIITGAAVTAASDAQPPPSRSYQHLIVR